MSDKIVIRMTGHNRDALYRFIALLQRQSNALGHRFSLEWGPTGHQDSSQHDAVLIAHSRRFEELRPLPEFADFPVLVHDRHARGFARLQIDQNRRQAGI